MINIDEALKDTGGTGPAAKIKLLSSRIAVEEVLSQKPDLKQVFERCQSELDSWNPKRAATDQPTVIGWINLAAEIARRRTDDGARAFSHSLPHAGTPTIFNLLALLDLVCYKSSDTTGVRGLIAADGFEDRKKWPTRHESWRTLLLESAEEKDALAKTDLGQTLVMHLLEAILPLYERATRVDHRGQFNLIVVPLIRAIFRYPDRAHTAYTRYMYGADRSGDGDAFELLYDHDLVVIAEFQRYATSKRSETLSEIRNLSQSEEQRGAATPTGDSREFPELPPALKRRANRILHGEKEEEETVHSPRPKRIRVSQLTCLVRQLETSGNHAAVVTKNKEYSSHMKGTRYRRMNMTADDRRHFKWVQHEESKQDAFLDCVRERYAGGYGA
ncbi:MAG: hypothetical protein HY650_03010, partial [Acidobacteria bacterium]|nr:hypothetical protein [Acidobacteriota bacterium]